MLLKPSCLCLQAEVCCKVLGFLSEDLTVFESSNSE